MMVVGVLLGTLGLVCLMAKRTLLGVLIGVQLLALGTTTTFVMGGIMAGVHDMGHIFGFFIILSGVAQLVVGYSLTIRMFYLRRKVEMDQLRALKH